ncbi:ATP synthase F1 subunit epsilon [Candidatus Peregrinibacteria bacterium]|nr:ATP synthase F1 subunit epsilon [Candidatus Peregrinibacteria bacterium]
MANKMEFKIVTPEKIIYDGQVDSVTFPAVGGEITVLAGHIPLVSAIRPGELKIKKNGNVEYFSVMKGVLEIDGKSMMLLTDAAERAEEIDEKRAEEAREKAKKLMADKRQDKEGYADAVAYMEKALSRLRVARKRRRGGHKSSMEE